MKHCDSELSPQILEEASDWFVEFSENAVDADARKQFHTWLRRSPEHVQAYLQVTAFWEDASLLEKGRTLASDKLVKQALAEGNVIPLAELTARVTEPDRGPRASKMRWFALAASLAVVTVAAGSWVFVHRGIYATAVGEQRSVRLDDGSTIDLNSRSRLRVRFNEHERDVELIEGQALFCVAKDTARPFIVSTDKTRVRAVGTQFDVYRKEGGTIVTVLEGRVAVVPELTTVSIKSVKIPETVGQKREMLLGAGEQLMVTPIAISPPAPADIQVATAWTRREIAFHGAPLSEVVEEFNRYNQRPMVIADRDIETTTISGVFSSTDPDSLLRFLRELADFDVQETEEEIRISRK